MKNSEQLILIYQNNIAFGDIGEVEQRRMLKEISAVKAKESLLAPGDHTALSKIAS